MASLLFHREQGMPGPRLPMRKIRDLLRLCAAGMSNRKIASSLGVSATAAGECIRRARRAGLSWPLPEGMTDGALERQLFAACGGGQGSPPAAELGGHSPRTAPARRNAAAVVGGVSRRPPRWLRD